MAACRAQPPQQSVEHHPEIQAVVYAQWFAYAFTIWEEQFRSRLARYWDSQTDAKIRRSDILIDYFGGIRIIRNDVVHNKGICDESANTVVLQWGFVEGQPIEISAEQMISVGRSPKTLREIVANQSANSPFDAYRLTARGVEAWVGHGEGQSSSWFEHAPGGACYSGFVRPIRPRGSAPHRRAPGLRLG